MRGRASPLTGLALGAGTEEARRSWVAPCGGQWWGENASWRGKPETFWCSLMYDSARETVSAGETSAEAAGLGRVCEPVEKGECCPLICAGLDGDVQGV